jgi:hypothetical protein
MPTCADAASAMNDTENSICALAIPLVSATVTVVIPAVTAALIWVMAVVIVVAQVAPAVASVWLIDAMPIDTVACAAVIATVAAVVMTPCASDQP